MKSGGLESPRKQPKPERGRPVGAVRDPFSVCSASVRSERREAMIAGAVKQERIAGVRER
jgi:hypothetical protein